MDTFQVTGTWWEITLGNDYQIGRLKGQLRGFDQRVIKAKTIWVLTGDNTEAEALDAILGSFEYSKREVTRPPESEKMLCGWRVTKGGTGGHKGSCTECRQLAGKDVKQGQFNGRVTTIPAPGVEHQIIEMALSGTVKALEQIRENALNLAAKCDDLIQMAQTANDLRRELEQMRVQQAEQSEEIIRYVTKA